MNQEGRSFGLVVLTPLLPGHVRIPRAVPIQLEILRVPWVPGSLARGPTTELMHCIIHTPKNTVPLRSDPFWPLSIPLPE